MVIYGAPPCIYPFLILKVDNGNPANLQLISQHIKHPRTQ